MADETVKAKLKDITNNKYVIPIIPEATDSETGVVIVDTALSATSKHPVQNKAIKASLDAKQDSISDLDTIRSGAAAGATALQELPVATTTTLGGVKADGDTILVDSEGVLTATAQIPEGVLTKSDLKAGENIYIAEESGESSDGAIVISAPTGWTKDNLRQGKNIQILRKTNPYVIDEYVTDLWHFDGTKDPVIGTGSISNPGAHDLNTTLKKFGTGSIGFNYTVYSSYNSSISTGANILGGLHDYTIDFWLRVDFTSDPTTIPLSFTFINGGTVDLSIILGQTTTATISAPSLGIANNTQFTLPHTISGDGFHHYALCYTAATRKLAFYVDGVLSFTDNLTTVGTSLRSGSFWRPVWGQYTVHSRGWIDELRVSSVCRWDEESFEVPDAEYTDHPADDWYVIAAYGDGVMSTTSENFLQNKIVTRELNKKLDSATAATTYATVATVNTKQDTLIEGPGITIEDNVISATATGGGAPTIQWFKHFTQGDYEVRTGMDLESFTVVKVYKNGVLLEETDESSEESSEENDYIIIGSSILFSDPLNSTDKVTVEAF